MLKIKDILIQQSLLTINYKGTITTPLYKCQNNKCIQSSDGSLTKDECSSICNGVPSYPTKESNGYSLFFIDNQWYKRDFFTIQGSDGKPYVNPLMYTYGMDQRASDLDTNIINYYSNAGSKYANKDWVQWGGQKKKLYYTISDLGIIYAMSTRDSIYSNVLDKDDSTKPGFTGIEGAICVLLQEAQRIAADKVLLPSLGGLPAGPFTPGYNSDLSTAISGGIWQVSNAEEVNYKDAFTGTNKPYNGKSDYVFPSNQSSPIWSGSGTKVGLVSNPWVCARLTVSHAKTAISDNPNIDFKICCNCDNKVSTTCPPTSIGSPSGANVSLCKPCLWGAFVLTGSNATGEGWNGPYQCYKFRQSYYNNDGNNIKYFLPNCRNSIVTGQYIRNIEFLKSDVSQSTVEEYDWYKEIKNNCPMEGSVEDSNGCG